MALQRNDYLEAVQEYRKAAELSDNPDIAKQATFTGMAFGFDDEALRAAKRWLEIQAESNEARAVVAQLSLRTGDKRAARRQFSKLLEEAEGSPGERLSMLVRLLGDEKNIEEADKLVRSLAKPYPETAAVSRGT